MEFKDLKDALARRKVGILDAQSQYAVLVPLLRRADGLHLLYEVRSAALRRQPGEVCFPGGKLEPGEAPLDCALRETWEELGLAREHFDLFDFVVIPPNHFHMENFVRPAAVATPGQVADLFMERLEEIGQLDIPHEKVGIAHITCGLIFREDPPHVFRLLDEKRMRKIFDVFAKKGDGIELNASSFRGWEELPEILRPYQWAKEAGCKFYCSSDSHSLEGYASVRKNLPPIAEALGLTEDDRYIVPEK